MADVVIRGALVCDGTGAPAQHADVHVRDERIVAVGTVGRERDATTIDGGGLVCAPGFIDLHTHYDCQLFWDAQASPSPAHGVTTVVMGNCGFTLAPCPPSQRETLMRLLSFVEGMPLPTLRAALPWSWESYPSFLDALERNGLGPNVAAFVGHSALRVQAMGADAVERAATPDEVAAMCGLLREALAAGALGFSTSLAPTHFFADDDKPAPSRVAAPDELHALAGTLRDSAHGVIEVAPKTIVGPADEKLAEQETFAGWARASGKPVSWAPLFQNPYQPGAARTILDVAGELQADGATVVPQVGCRPLELRFDFATPGFGLDNNPFWRPFMALPRDERRRRFADPAFRDELRAHSRGFKLALVAEWSRLVLRLPARDATAAWQDHSVADVAAARGVDPIDAFCDLVLADDLEGQWGAWIFNVDEHEMADMLRHPAGVLALSDAGAHMDTLCDQGFTTWLLGHWVRDRGLLTLEEAVQMLTSVPARRYGLVGRGTVAPGQAADLVLFDPASVATRRTELVHDLPQGQRRLLQGADGVVHVLVGGRAVIAGGVATSDRPGRLLRGGR